MDLYVMEVVNVRLDLRHFEAGLATDSGKMLLLATGNDKAATAAAARERAMQGYRGIYSPPVWKGWPKAVVEITETGLELPPPVPETAELAVRVDTPNEVKFGLPDSANDLQEVDEMEAGWGDDESED